MDANTIAAPNAAALDSIQVLAQKTSAVEVGAAGIEEVLAATAKTS